MITYPTTYGMNRPIYSGGTIRIRPVASIEEVKASPIDFDGSLFYFHDVANKKIYTKQINLDGMVQIDSYVFALDPIQPTEEPAAAEYITKEEFQTAIQDLLTELKGETEHEPVSINPKFDF